VDPPFHKCKDYVFPIKQGDFNSKQEAEVIWRMHRTHCTTQDSLAVAVPGICRRLHKLKVGHVTPPRMTRFVWFWLGSAAIYMHAKFQVFSPSRTGDTRRYQNFELCHDAPSPTPYDLIVHSFRYALLMPAKFKVSSFSHSWDTKRVPNFKSRSPPLHFLWGDQDSRLTQCLMGPQECSSQTAF